MHNLFCKGLSKKIKKGYAQKVTLARELDQEIHKMSESLIKCKKVEDIICIW